MKINVYIMHSEKRDYKNEIYKPLLELGLMKDYYLILPLSEKYKSTYIKTLLSDSDVVICDLSNKNFLLDVELRYAKKLNKIIYYMIDEKDKNIKKIKIENIITYSNKEDYSIKVSNILKSLNTKEMLLKRENIYCLGKIEK